MPEDTQEYTADPIGVNKSNEWAKFLSNVLDTTTTENGTTDLRRVEEAVRLVNSIIDNVEQMCTSGIISTKDAQVMVKQMLDPEAMADPIVYTPSDAIEKQNDTGSFLIEFSHADREFIDAIWTGGYGSDKIAKGVHLHRKYLKHKVLAMLHMLSNYMKISYNVKPIPNDSKSIPFDEFPFMWMLQIRGDSGSLGADIHFEYPD